MRAFKPPKLERYIGGPFALFASADSPPGCSCTGNSRVLFALCRALDGPTCIADSHTGVVYVPEDELQCHYSLADMAGQYDIVMHFDWTDAVHKLDDGDDWAATAGKGSPHSGC